MVKLDKKERREIILKMKETFMITGKDTTRLDLELENINKNSLKGNEDLNNYIL